MKILIGLGAVFVAAIVSFQVSFTIPEQAEVMALEAESNELKVRCLTENQVTALDRDGKLSLLVWNIYKQQKESWQSQLQELSTDVDLILLQEASLTPSLKSAIKQAGWVANLVRAFDVLDTSAGVLSLSRSQPSSACAHTALEPWLRLPKSALLSLFPLSTQENLAVVNIHGVNFTLGTEEYHAQLSELQNALEAHQGPIIVAGDFNTWSEDRLAVVRDQVGQLGLKEVSFTDDHRTQFLTGLPLDHIFYRGLELEKAEAPKSDASDHNPMIAHFRLQNSNE
ncbi:endonuclease/exonuclease/phosphatase family protein [Vibrio sp. Of7-15]|uniref:endonuclease/exonuclease/phosphatase family protein n=1 Tax=Vibrio sp. Of7-15 TaxID=2724879 RepID=UPI001EF398EE|nr:endonuclease/exonuclease/phosphatase family protein [Vibrio sp. Of7-15]MCG7498409.1 endonuclease/exonuclease/phosphatase family protein [Vibrio sp. Of7-15]